MENGLVDNDKSCCIQVQRNSVILKANKDTIYNLTATLPVEKNVKLKYSCSTYTKFSIQDTHSFIDIAYFLKTAYYSKSAKHKQKQMGQGIQEWTKYNLSLPFTNFNWYILEYFDPNVKLIQFSKLQNKNDINDVILFSFVNQERI